MNKQSNLYTVIYIIVLVVVVGAAMAITATSLRSRQQANEDADKMRQILASVRITPEKSQIISDYQRYITDSYVVNSEGRRVDGDAFTVDVAKQVKLADADRLLPVYVCTLADGETKYVLPMYGAGLWGPIWGYVSLDSDGSTIYGAYFAHEGETPGLGAEIEKPAFSSKFDGKQLLKDDKFVAVEVVKAGQVPVHPEADYVDGVTGGTITSKGVGSMIDNSLKPYTAFLTSLQKHE